MKKILNKETISYLIFGVLTTVVYFLTRFFVVYLTGNSMAGVVYAQISAILFAFFTNKLFVFKDKDWSIKVVMIQLLGFIIGRLFVFFLDIGITYLAVQKNADFFIHLFWLDQIDYNSFFFASPLMRNFIGSEKLLNEFIFALFVQVLAIILNYIISKKAIFKK